MKHLFVVLAISFSLSIVSVFFKEFNNTLIGNAFFKGIILFSAIKLYRNYFKDQSEIKATNLNSGLFNSFILLFALFFASRTIFDTTTIGIYATLGYTMLI